MDKVLERLQHLIDVLTYDMLAMPDFSLWYIEQAKRKIDWLLFMESEH